MVEGLIPVLLSLLKKPFEKGVDILLEELRKKLEGSTAKSEAREVQANIQTLNENPDDAEPRGELKANLKAALRQDPALEAQLQEWLSKARPISEQPGSHVRMVATARDGGVVNQVSGSNNQVKINNRR